jgi:uncharacterized membrane protein YuzA (DUF378 family)
MDANRGIWKVLLILSVIGAINWGLVGFFNWNLVDAIFGGGAIERTTGASRFIYALVGLAGLASLVPLVTGTRSARGGTTPRATTTRPTTTPVTP